MKSVNFPPGLTSTIRDEANSMADSIVKTFEYKIKHTQSFTKAAGRMLEMSRFVYNCGLEHRILRYRQGRPIGFYEQSRELTEARELADVGNCIRAIQVDALERLDLAFKAFFRRLNGGETPGFPRFKGHSRYSTFSQKIERYRRSPLTRDVLKIPGVGTVKVRLSRPIEGKVKMLRITRRADGWYALLICELPKPEPLPKTGLSVGVDVGLTHLATLSDGTKIENPRHLRRAAKALKRSQQALSRAKKRSAGRMKARQRVALRHLKVQRARKDFHHKMTSDLVNRFDRIAVEDLEIPNMMKNRALAKSIADAGWGQFTSILASKAENAGREFVRVPAAYTSQTCSACGHRQKIPLAVRTFACTKCSHKLDRDHNAAINIGRSAPKFTPAENNPVRGSRNRQAGPNFSA